MAYTLKKDHVTNWDLPNGYGRFMNDEDDDSSIPERSSLALSEEDNPPEESSKKFTTPEIPKEKVVKHNTLQYHYNKLPDNGLPLAIQYQKDKEEEKKRQKNLRKAPPGQGKLAPVPEIKSDQSTLKNFFPHQRYIREQHPDLVQNSHQNEEGYVLPGDPLDASKYLPEGSLSVLSYKPHERQKKKKKKTQRVRNIRYNEEKKQYEYVDDSSKLDQSDSPGNTDKSTSKRQHYYKNDQSDGSKLLPSMYADVHHKGKHQHSNRHHRHHHHHHHHHSQELKPLFPQAKQRPIENTFYSPRLEYESCEFDVNSVWTKTKTHSIYFKPTDEYHNPPLVQVYNQGLHLPPVSRDQPRISPHSNFKRDWFNSLDDFKAFKSDSNSKFYDRYLNNVIEKRLH